ncbi:hypothetical protein [Haloarcula rubripromontorii]|uniref:hypothetical protein n=1 Tax=Haloarcula rubripromontorii TaxID=1705562 RepID=UPI00197FAE76|nr:hypothetical protein [Haloarcula rubripromontorii]
MTYQQLATGLLTGSITSISILLFITMRLVSRKAKLDQQSLDSTNEEQQINYLKFAVLFGGVSVIGSSSALFLSSLRICTGLVPPIVTLSMLFFWGEVVVIALTFIYMINNPPSHVNGD